MPAAGGEENFLEVLRQGQIFIRNQVGIVQVEGDNFGGSHL